MGIEATGASKAGSNGVSNRQPKKTRTYSTRRAATACEVCRSRKSRCSGGRPACQLCHELGMQCVYRPRGIYLGVGDKAILERLDKIESLVRRGILSQQCGSDSDESQSAPAGEGAVGVKKHGNDSNPLSPLVSPVSRNVLCTWTQRATATNINIMTQAHTSAAMHLLNWPVLRDLSTCCDRPQTLLHAELARETFHTAAQTFPVDLTNSEVYVDAYFERVNVWYACVNRNDWACHYHTATLQRFRRGPESCMVLLVLALGKASLQGSISRMKPGAETPGLHNFSAAWCLLPSIMTAHSPMSAQCELLATAYLFYLVRPIEAWTLLQSINLKLQLLLASPSVNSPDQRELLQRIYWNSMLFESDLLTEMDLPGSNISQIEEDIGLPCGFNARVVKGEPVEEDELWYFLAKIALRRLMNRVSQLIHTSDGRNSTTSSESVMAELDRQLVCCCAR